MTRREIENANPCDVGNWINRNASAQRAIDAIIRQLTAIKKDLENDEAVLTGENDGTTRVESFREMRCISAALSGMRATVGEIAEALRW